jgi:F-type H+/Na+-transporting ATPase subunit alpha
MEKGKDVLIVYDDLTSHARAYREISLLLERPPGREAYPGDIFFIHARLLERSTNLKRFANGGSLTSLPIIETQAQNISSYIVTNLISITDGQIYLSPDLFQKNQLPAIDVGKSVSRVGGKTQLPAYQKVMGDLRLSYAQFEELEMFSRFGTRLDDETKKTINRGRKVRKVLTQDQYKPMHVSEQIAVLVAVTSGVFDDIAESKVKEAEEIVKQAIKEELPDIYKKITEGEKLSDDQQKQIKSMAIKACAHLEGTS